MLGREYVMYAITSRIVSRRRIAGCKALDEMSVRVLVRFIRHQIGPRRLVVKAALVGKNKHLERSFVEANDEVQRHQLLRP